MNARKKRLLIAALALAALVWLLCTFHVVEGRLYRKNAETLDLRGREITVAHYEKLCAKLPQARILWDIPFQGGFLDQQAEKLTVTTLTQEDAQILAAYLPQLRVVNGEQCPDLENLCSLARLRPDVRVAYKVTLSGREYDGSAVSVILDDVTEEELEILSCLPLLKTVTVRGGEAQRLQRLRDWCEGREIALRIRICGEDIALKAIRAELDGITDRELGVLPLLTKLKQLHLTEPAAAAEKLLALRQQLPQVTVTWEKSVLGLPFPHDAKEIDLTEVISLDPGQQPGEKTGYQYGLELPVQGTQEEIPTAIRISKYHPIADRTEETGDLIAQVEEAMAYFPEAEQVVLVGGLLENEAMSAFREAHRQDYKVVWSVRCGKVLTRSDADFFMPVKYHVYYLSDAEACNLRYLEEAVAVDIGHMNVSDISFVTYMPELEYLILAHTSVQYIEPIRSCKKLKFLELDWSGIRDLTPLQDCTALEDLNIGNTGVNVEPLTKMPWLKNVWMIFKKSAYILTQALPDTRVVSSGNATVASGWRDLPNYYAMRDQLKMYYMSW